MSPNPSGAGSDRRGEPDGGITPGPERIRTQDVHHITLNGADRQTSICFREPLGHLIELACYRFEPPAGRCRAEVLRRAHDIRSARGAMNIEDADLAAAIEAMVAEDRPGIAESS